MRVFVTAEDIRLLDRHTELAIRDADHDGHALGTEVFGSHAHRFHAELTSIVVYEMPWAC